MRIQCYQIKPCITSSGLEVDLAISYLETFALKLASWPNLNESIKYWHDSIPLLMRSRMISNMLMLHHIWPRSRTYSNLAKSPWKPFAVSLASLPDEVRHRQVWYHSTPRALGYRMSLNLCKIKTIKPLWPRRKRFKPSFWQALTPLIEFCCPKKDNFG